MRFFASWTFSHFSHQAASVVPSANVRAVPRHQRGARQHGDVAPVGHGTRSFLVVPFQDLGESVAVDLECR